MVFFFLYNFIIWSEVSLYTAWSREETHHFFFSEKASQGRTIRLHHLSFSFMGLCILAKDQLILIMEYFWYLCCFPLDLMFVLREYHSAIINRVQLACEGILQAHSFLFFLLCYQYYFQYLGNNEIQQSFVAQISHFYKKQIHVEIFTRF